MKNLNLLKVRLSQNEFMKSSILQNSNWKIWRISALASKTRSNKKSININIFIYFSKYESAFIFLIDLFLEARAEILQIFQLLFWVYWRFYKFIPTLIWPLNNTLVSSTLYRTFKLEYIHYFWLFGTSCSSKQTPLN